MKPWPTLSGPRMPVSRLDPSAALQPPALTASGQPSIPRSAWAADSAWASTHAADRVRRVMQPRAAERERTLAGVRRRRLPGEQMLRMLGVHSRKRVPTAFGMYASPKRAPIA